MYDDIEPGEVLWIGPDICHVPAMPDGFAFRVVDFLGWGGDDPNRRREVWVRGPVLDARGVPVRMLTLCVPVNQRRAVAVTPEPPPPEERPMVGPPPGFRRRASH